MKLGIMQPYFLPYIGYFQLINAVDKYVIYDDVNFIKRGWINRNNILLCEKSFLFTLALLEASQNKLINEIFVYSDQSKLLKTIHTAYKKAPQFFSVFPMVEKIFEYENKNLARYVGNSIIQIADYLRLETEFIYSSDIKGKDSLLKAQNKVLNICNVLGASKYINAIGGMVLYDKESFKKKDIDVFFIKTKSIEYQQFKKPFVANLSMLDVLMFNSVEEVQGLLGKYELI